MLIREYFSQNKILGFKIIKKTKKNLTLVLIFKISWIIKIVYFNIIKVKKI